nr:hypothetical protein [Bacteroidota bacterium]
MKLNYKNGMVIRIALLVLITLALCPEAKPDKFTKPNEPGPWPGLEVNTCTGNLYLQRTDLVIPCRGIPLN